MKRVRVTREARNDVAALASWIAQHDPAAARRTIEALRQRLTMLGDHPQIGRSRPDIAPGLHGHAVSPYLVLYRIDEGAVTIVRIVDGRRDLTQLFQD